MDLKEICQRAPMVPVIAIDDLADALPLAEALIKGGIDVLEVTLRTDCGLDAITQISNAFPEAVVGVGSVKTPKDVSDSIKAGAKFGVSPGMSPKLQAAILEADFPFLPGCATPSEAMSLYEAGFDILKFFPAEAAGGIDMLKSINAPLPHISFCPTGGISLKNAQDYLSLPNVITIGGSWVVPKDLLKAKNFQAIQTLAQETTDVLKG
jgi:2-dehydro-3-deoxyphosphogluconate aldolase/(4S)-4-hydroxy-2-oxoglutarate aldolase